MATRGERFFFHAKYDKAMEVFLKEEARDKQDSSRHGVTLNIAQVLICTGRFKEALDVTFINATLWPNDGNVTFHGIH